MKNKQRGEVTIDGPGGELKLCLTLGAIAQLEDGLGIDSLTEIGEVLTKASMKHMLLIIKALAAGGGNPLSDDQLMTWQADLPSVMEKIQDCFQAAGFSDPDDEDKDDKERGSEKN